MFKHQVNFEAVVVAPEKQIGRQALVKAVLEHFGNDPGFKHRTARSMGLQLIGRTNAQQPAEQTAVQEIQLGRFHQALAKVAVVRRQQRHQMAGLQDREPLARGGLGDAAVSRQAVEVEQLAAACCAHGDKGLKAEQVADVEHLAHIALDVGAHVGRKPVAGLHLALLGVHHRVRAAPKCLHQVGPWLCGHFWLRQCQQGEHAHPTRQGLRDAMHQAKLLRAREHKTPHAAGFVGHAQQVGHQLRGALHFIENGAISVAAQEAARIQLRGLTRVGVFKIDVGQMREGRPRQSRLARLPRPRDGQHGKPPRQGTQRRLCGTVEHALYRIKVRF